VLEVLLLLMSDRIKIDIEMVCINKTYFQAKWDCIRINPDVNAYPLIFRSHSAFGSKTTTLHSKTSNYSKLEQR